MLDRLDLEPVFFAPFVSSVMRVEPAWIDYNGHLNMAYYNVLFDRAVDEVFELLGCGADYVKKGFSTFTAEVHVRYLRELHEGDPVRVTFQLLEYDHKRMHYFEQLFHAEETKGAKKIGSKSTRSSMPAICQIFAGFRKAFGGRCVLLCAKTGDADRALGAGLTRPNSQGI